MWLRGVGCLYCNLLCPSLVSSIVPFFGQPQSHDWCDRASQSGSHCDVPAGGKRAQPVIWVIMIVHHCLCTHMSMFICVCVCMYLCVYVCVCVHACMCVSVAVCVCGCVCMRLYVHASVCACYITIHYIIFNCFLSCLENSLRTSLHTVMCQILHYSKEPSHFSCDLYILCIKYEFKFVVSPMMIRILFTLNFYTV